MKVYDQNGNLLEEYDLELGRLEPSTETVHHEAVEEVQEQYHYETVAEYPNGGKDVRKVVDVPAVPGRAAWTEEVPISIYIPYTDEEFAAMEAERNQPTQEQRIAALEQENAELKEALELLLSGEVE